MKTLGRCFAAELLLSGWLTLCAPLQSATSIQFSRANYTWAESALTATLSVRRFGEATTPVGVDFATADGTATNGFRYTATSGTLAFAAGETNKTVVVPITNNGLVDGAKIFHVLLSNPTSGAVLGAITNASVHIIDNDFGIQFQMGTHSVNEDGEVQLIGVVRGDDGTLPVTVDFYTTDLSAKSGVDYTGVTNTLSFYNGGALKITDNFPSNTPPFPGVRQTIRFWAGYNGASDPVTDPEPTLNLDSGLPGLDTVVTRFSKHPLGGAVELWTINGGMHFPDLSTEFAPQLLDWLLAHPKP